MLPCLADQDLTFRASFVSDSPSPTDADMSYIISDPPLLEPEPNSFIPIPPYLLNAPWNLAVGRVFFSLDNLYLPLFEESPSSPAANDELSEMLLDTFQNFSRIPIGLQAETGKWPTEDEAVMEDVELGWVVDDVGADMNEREDGTERMVIDEIVKDVGIRYLRGDGNVVGEEEDGEEEGDHIGKSWNNRPDK